MGLRARLLSLAVLACPLIAAPACARNVALLVGVGQFSDPQINPLLGPTADLEAVQRTLSGRWGFAAGDIRVLHDRDATHDRILAEIGALEQRSAPGDTVLIYFSGHGTSANDNENAYDLPYATGAWVPTDLDLSSTATVNRSLIIGRRDLVPLLKRLDQGGRWVVVVSDSCFSGQVVRSFGRSASRSRYLKLAPRDLGVAHAAAAPAPSTRPAPPPYPYQHVVLLSGASDSEEGADISSPAALELAPTLDGKYHGAFTDAFLRLLDGQLRPPPFNYSQGRDAMNEFLEHHNFAQHPQLLPALAEDPEDVGSMRFFTARIAASPAAATAAVVPAPAPGVHDATVHVRLDGVSAALRGKIAQLPGIAIVESGSDLTVRERGAQAELLGPAGDPIVKTAAADPLLGRRIAAQAWLNNVLPVSNDALGLRAETSPGSRGNTFVQCESFAVEVRLRRPAYVMVLDLDAQGNFTVLYPTRAAERQRVGADAPKAIPGADPKDQVLVVPPFGTDQMSVIAFEQQPAFFVELTGADRFAADAPRGAALAKGLSAAAGAVDVQQIDVHTYPGRTGGLCGS